MGNVDSFSKSGSLPLFTEQERQSILNDLLAALGQDERLAGALLVGSAAEDFEDRFSDIDLTIVVSAGHQVAGIFSEWKSKMAELFAVQSSFEVTYGPDMFLAGFLLTNYLELDVGFLGISDLFAKRRRWKVAFDRSGRIEEIMQSSWANREVVDPEVEYRHLLGSIWHYITHVALSVSRRHKWRAIHYLEAVRTKAIELACIRRGYDPHHFRPVHRLPQDFQIELQKTLPQSTDGDEILRALAKSSEIFFDECRMLDQEIGQDLSANLRSSMDSYLNMFRNPNPFA